jgi:hypothetical protein
MTGSLKVEMEWRPIETAPKDGRTILVAVATKYPHTRPAWWDASCWSWVDENGEPGGTHRTAVTGGWRFDDRVGGWLWPNMVMHWMPLPEPPR